MANQKFAIISEGRAGTTLLVQAMKDVGIKVSNEILCFASDYLEEPLQEYIRSMGYPCPSKKTHKDKEFRDKINYEEYFDLAYSLHDGCKFLHYQLDHSGLEYFKKNNIKVIMLYRENQLNTYISNKMAEKTGIYVSLTGKSENPTIEVDMNDLYHSFIHKDRWMKKIEEEFSVIKVSYEDLVSKWETMFPSVCSQIGHTIKAPEQKVKKIIKKDYKDIVYNYDELSSFLQTSFSRPIKFSYDWFSWRIPVFQKHLQISKDRPCHFLEIGSYEGKSACWLMENILTHSDSTLTCVDPFYKGYGNQFFKNMANQGYMDKCIPIKSLSTQGIRNLPRNKYDFIYIDGEHYSKNALEDAILAWPLLRKGGILAFDDYGWSGTLRDRSGTDAPKIGIDSFLSTYVDEFEILQKDYQVWIRKI